MMNKTKFITTSDKEMSDVLIQRGFTLVCYDGDFWTFLTNAIMDFSEDELGKVQFTNMLMM